MTSTAQPDREPVDVGSPSHTQKPLPGSVGLVINTYNQPEYLGRVLQAVSRQVSRPDEVLLADDGSGSETKTAFVNWAASQKEICSVHIWQEHEGFRRSRILNEAIARSRSEYLVFLDGDTIPHPLFIADHRELRRANAFIQGHRALLKQSGAAWFGLGSFSTDRRRALWTLQLQGWKHAFRWPRPWVRRRQDLRGVRGCNLAIWREDLVRVNGYNEAFKGWGREDSELAVRLMNSGVRRLDARGRALCYHLWHPVASRAGLSTNDALLAQAQQSGAKRCDLGLQEHTAK